MLALLSLLVAALPLCVRADDENMPILVLFGDSFADTGNCAAITRSIEGPVYPSPDLYYNGRASNGRIWPDYVKNMTGWDSLNYAVSRTTACSLSDEVLGFNASLSTQVSKFLQKEVPWMDEESPEESMRLLNSSRPLVIAITAGSNDFQLIFGQAVQQANRTGMPVNDVMQGLINNGTLNTTTTASCYMGAVSRLLPSDEQTSVDLRRVRGMVLFGLSTIQKSPLTRDPKYIGFSNTTRALIGQQVQGLNSILEDRISELPSTVQARFINLVRVQEQYASGEFSPASDLIADEPCLDVIGIQGAEDVTINGTCDNPSNYIFWDTVHVTTPVHEALATNLLVDAFQDVASGPMSAPADERSGEAAITIKTRMRDFFCCQDSHACCVAIVQGLWLLW